jgi:hypothetical protein
MYHKVAAQPSFITVWVREAHAHVQTLVLVVKLATMLEERPTEEQQFLGQNNSMQRAFLKKCFLFTVGSVCV